MSNSENSPDKVDLSHSIEDDGENQKSEFTVIDKRHFLDSGMVAADAAVDEKPRYPKFVEELLGRVAETERKFEEKKKEIDEEIKRARERLESDYERKLDLEKQKMLLQFLEVLDNLERALAAGLADSRTEGLVQGIEMTATLFRSKLQALGVEPIDLLNRQFDPNLGQAIGVVPVTREEEDGVVIEEVLRGYLLGEELLRAAQVRVGRYEDETFPSE